MSTYTDLHIKTKDTINVDHCSGITNQKVKFVNPENVFRGTFIGTHTLSGNNNIDGGTITNVSIDNAFLKDVTFANGLDPVQIKQELVNIDEKIDDRTDMLLTAINQVNSSLSTRITNLSNVLTQKTDFLSSSIDSVNADLYDISSHYTKTFSEQHYVNGPDTYVDTLNITNSEDTTDQYSLQFLSGTLVLVKHQ